MSAGMKRTASTVDIVFNRGFAVIRRDYTFTGSLGLPKKFAGFILESEFTLIACHTMPVAVYLAS